MYRAQTEAVIKTMIRDIVKECTTKGETVSETLAAFMVKSVVLDPSNDYVNGRALSSEEVDRLVQLCVVKLLDKSDPSLDTIKMQVYFDLNYTQRKNFLQEHREGNEHQLQKTLTEITDSRARTRDDLEALYRQIVSYVLLRSAVGSPTDINVVREVTAAMQSIFPQIELGSFMTIPKVEKEKQMKELTYITTGIRLFNWSCDQGGAGIDNLVELVHKAIQSVDRKLNADLMAVLTHCFRCTAILEHYSKPGAVFSLEPEIEYQLRAAMIHTRQHEVFLRLLMADLNHCRTDVEPLENQYASLIDFMKSTIHSKAAIPTIRVYPTFLALGQLWTRLQEEIWFCEMLESLVGSLKTFAKDKQSVLTDEFFQVQLENLPVLSDNDRIAKSNSEDDRLEQANVYMPRLEVFYPQTVKNFSELPIEYKSFCAFSLAVHNGLLLPGNANIGLVCYCERYYCFSSTAAAKHFIEEPAKYVAAVIQIAKSSPELIQLLDLHTQFNSVTRQGTSQGQLFGHTPVTTCNAGVQTEVHPIETNIVKSYEWNEWELRRKAIQLANIRQKATQAVQTVLSNFQRCSASQAYPPREKETQTMRTKHTSVPKPASYMVGLRGDTNNLRQAAKVDLTPSIHTHTMAEDLQPKNH